MRTTIPDRSDRKFPDVPLVDSRDLYPATVIDLHSRKLAGWAMADRMVG